MALTHALTAQDVETIRTIIARSKMNWSREIRCDESLTTRILLATAELNSAPFKDRVLMVLTGQSPVCPNGKMRKFVAIDKGWAFCARGRECRCLTDHKSATIGAGKQAAKEAALAAAADAELPSDIDARRRLTHLVTTSPKTLASQVRQDPGLLRWVSERSRDLPDHATFAERCYVALHGSVDTTCSRGQRRKFYSVVDGYEGCCETDSQCACRREAHGETMRLYHAGSDPDERERRIAAQQHTLLQRHGVINPSHVAGAREKMEATNLERYGDTHHMRNAEVRQRVEDTLERRYGARTPGGVPEFHDQRKATNLTRYGVDSTMHLARDAYRQQTGLENPFQHPDVKAKALATMLSRHGVARALQSPEIRETMREKLLARYGAGNVMQIEDVRVRLRSNTIERIGRISHNQSHFSDETYEILCDKKRFAALFVGRSLRDVAAYLGIGYDTARKYCYKFGIALPKSSYEVALRDFIQGLGISTSEIIAPTRKLIPPYEVDLFIPSHNLAIEFCGLYWHRDAIKDADYHRMKLDRVREAGVRLLTIAEDEWVHHQAIVKMRIAHALGYSARGAGARACEIKTISAGEAKAFLERYHLQGSGVYGFANYGAYHGGTLVAVMTFSRGRLGVGVRRMELLRFATDGRTFPGLAQRLFQRFVGEHDPETILSYADRRWSDGNLYRKLGFSETGVTDPNYWYVDCDKIRRYHRFLYRKDKISHLVDDPENMTEREIMSFLGFHRFYDCGSYIFEWKR